VGHQAIVAWIERKALPASRFGRYRRNATEHTLGSLNGTHRSPKEQVVVEVEERTSGAKARRICSHPFRHD
jgi:hypothetical protein